MNEPRLRNALLLISLALLGGTGIGFAIAHRPVEAPIVITGAPGLNSLPTPPDPGTATQNLQAAAQGSKPLEPAPPTPLQSPPAPAEPMPSSAVTTYAQAATPTAASIPNPDSTAAAQPPATGSMAVNPPQDGTPAGFPAKSSESHTSSHPEKLKSPGDGQINLNTSSLDDLERLPGVGPALAQRIIDYRTQSGPFQNPQDLMQVHGIGPKKYARMQPFVVTQ